MNATVSYGTMDLSNNHEFWNNESELWNKLWRPYSFFDAVKSFMRDFFLCITFRHPVARVV